MSMLYVAQTMTEAHPMRGVGYIASKIAIIVMVGILIRRTIRRHRQKGNASHHPAMPPYGAPYSPHPNGPWGPPQGPYTAPGQPWTVHRPPWPTYPPAPPTPLAAPSPQHPPRYPNRPW